jgi:gliding motility-associated-like protein
MFCYSYLHFNVFAKNYFRHHPDDIFRIPPGVQFNLQELAIFDAWGNKIFTSDDRNSGWDGTYRGEPATAGVYVYLILGKTLAGTPLFLKGTVLLIR